MNRRDVIERMFVFTLANIAVACGAGSPASPSAISHVPSRPFDPRLGGHTLHSFTSGVDGFLYEALNDARIIPASSRWSSVDTKFKIAFHGHLIHTLIMNGQYYNPQNGFDFKINGREFYDPMYNGKSIIADYYQFPVSRGSDIAITLPPKWDQVSD